VDIKDGDLAYSNYYNYVWNELLTNVGDFDGNGMEDVLLSVGMRIAVFSSPAILPLDPYAADATISLPESAIGYTILRMTDFDGDGYSDLGVSLAPEGSDPNKEEVAILKGPMAGTFDLLERADAIVAAPVDGSNGWKYYAWEFQPGGDLFGDDQATLIAQDGSEYPTGDASIYVFGGPFSGSMTVEPEATITSTGMDSGFFQIASNMDVNADGVGDLLFSYEYYLHSGHLVGSPAAYLYLGPLCGNMTYDDADIRLQPYSPAFVRSVSTAGDISGDGVDDVILSVESESDWTDAVDHALHGSADLMARMMAHN
jgi:hypothetical protein